MKPRELDMNISLKYVNTGQYYCYEIMKYFEEKSKKEMLFTVNYTDNVN